MSNNLVTVQDDFITALKQNKNHTKIAEKSGINLRTIENWIYKNTNPSLFAASMVAKAIGYDFKLEKTI